MTIRIWRARLEFAKPKRTVDIPRLGNAIGIGLAVGAMVRLPAVWLGASWFYPRFLPLLVLLSLAAYFWLENRDQARLLAGLVLTGIVSVYLALLPGNTAYADSVAVALIHVPILFWAYLGFVFMGDSWRNADARLRFVRYHGELLILASLVGLGGIVFSGLTVALFQLVLGDWADWYAGNIGLIGAVAVPVVATYLYDVVFRQSTGIASMLVRIFAPLFLIMTAGYLLVAAVGGQNPFLDRESLITANALLLIVLGMTVLSVAERREESAFSWADYVNLSLLVVTLLVDLVALSAILFRLTSYGFTPNRVVVLGINLVALGHVIWTARAYVALFRKQAEPGSLTRAVTAYLPLYVVWAAIVVFILPFVFGFS